MNHAIHKVKECLLTATKNEPLMIENIAHLSCRECWFIGPPL